MRVLLPLGDPVELQREMESTINKPIEKGIVADWWCDPFVAIDDPATMRCASEQDGVRCTKTTKMAAVTTVDRGVP